MTLLQLVLRLVAQTQRPLAERGRDGRDRNGGWLTLVSKSSLVGVSKAIQALGGSVSGAGHLDCVTIRGHLGG